MQKRQFLKLSTAALTGAALSPILSCSTKNSEPTNMKNWAGNLAYSSKAVHEPSSVEEVVDIIKSNSKLRVLGTRHCFNRIADTTATHLSTAQLNRIVKIDSDNWSVTVEGGI